MDALRRLFNTPPLELIVLVSALIVIYNILSRLQSIDSRWNSRTYQLVTIVASAIISIALASVLVRLL